MSSSLLDLRAPKQDDMFPDVLSVFDFQSRSDNKGRRERMVEEIEFNGLQELSKVGGKGIVMRNSGYGQGRKSE